MTVSDVWSRATAAGATTGVVYLTVQSPTADQITGASVPADIAAVAQLHETTGGGSSMMGMQQVSSVSLPAGTAVAFEPGGYHIMLVDLAAPLTDGQQFPVTLTFAAAPPQTVTATVRS